MVLRDRLDVSERLWVTQDANWNVTGLVGGTGAVVERYAHDPYGAVTVLTGSFGSRGSSNYGWTQGFQGMFFDSISASYKSRGRTDISPTLGRPFQVDVLRFAAGDVNFYRWERSNPINRIDPSGLIAWTYTQTGASSAIVQMNVIIKMQFVPYQGDCWTPERREKFKSRFRSRVESVWNNNTETNIFGVTDATITIKAAAGGARNGPRWWTPRLSITVIDDASAVPDFTAIVKANKSGKFIQSSALLGGPTAWLDEDDMNWTTKESGFLGFGSAEQVPAAHEFGHLLGLRHPGDPGAPDEYSKDKYGLMGSGRDMRKEYYQRWLDNLRASHADQGPFNFEVATPQAIVPFY